LASSGEDEGAAALAMVLNHLGKSVTIAELRPLVLHENGLTTALLLVRAAERFGMRARGVKIESHQIGYIPSASILHWNGNRFVVFERLTDTGVEIIDPLLGRGVCTRAEFERAFLQTGVALFIARPGMARAQSATA
jgi:ABC-type bacteriocin/lantibiotic exporter with double-glycine peptidase domain